MNQFEALLKVEKPIVVAIEHLIKASIEKDGYWSPTGEINYRPNPDFLSNEEQKCGIKFVEALPPIPNEVSDWTLVLEATYELRKVFDALKIPPKFKMLMTDGETSILFRENGYKRRAHGLMIDAELSVAELEQLHAELNRLYLLLIIANSSVG
jgi:hypothetical protein